MDFAPIVTEYVKKGVVRVYPDFRVMKSKDLMIQAGDFYAIWVPDRNEWSKDEDDVIQMIDHDIDIYVENNKDRFGDDHVIKAYMHVARTGTIDEWHKYCKSQLRDNFHTLDDNLTFSNTVTKKEDYSSKRLPYPLEAGSIEAYDRLMSVLYSEEERHKIEWAIGSIVSGDSKKIQKFVVFYGAAGTGKSTVLNIIQKLFVGYCCTFDAKRLASTNSEFSLEPFRDNPLVAIQHDADLSRIKDNTRLNSLVSHEPMSVNVKNQKAYSDYFKCFLFMGSNNPVEITDAKSGLIRRLIDVSPTGKKLAPAEYRQIMKKINFELGAIAKHCLDVYEEDPGYYDSYVPLNMLGATNDFYNFVLDSYLVFAKENGTSLNAAWEMYKVYCDDANVSYKMPRRVFKEELKSYFNEYTERCTTDDGTRVRNYYSGFKKDKFIESPKVEYVEPQTAPNWLIFSEQPSVFDTECADCYAQYANEDGTPIKKWENVRTKLKSLDTSKLHYVRVPENHIVIDFDIPDENGEKSLEKNLAEAAKWPETYAEVSKSGKGVHLHYIYSGDPSELSRIYDEHVEVKVFTGNSSLRRMLTICNSLLIATISSGLPLKGDKKVVSEQRIKSEKGLRRQIIRNLKKEIHPYTKPSMDFIKKILDDAYESGMQYDLSDMQPAVLKFAASSSNNSDYCVKLMSSMKFKSADEENSIDISDSKIAIYDVEVFPNLFLVCWKYEGEGATVVPMFNPSPVEIEPLFKLNLVGYNCRHYDNHIMYGRQIGYTNLQIFSLSSKIVSGDKKSYFGAAWDASYTDVYELSILAQKKQSLKKWEIELWLDLEGKLEMASKMLTTGKSIEDISKDKKIKIPVDDLKMYLDGTKPNPYQHKELNLPWDQPVSEELWGTVADYCANDVRATELVFEHLRPSFIAKKILADLAGSNVNDTTNNLTTKIIFGKDKHPQSKFNYRNMACEGSPTFPGYKYENGVSTYRGEEVGEGGYVYAEPGIYYNVALLDIASMHPSSVVAENLFGDEYTQRFKDILDVRVAIKHKDFEKAKTMLGGKLAKYLSDENDAKALSSALKIAINSVYGLTAANFDNPFRDIRNVDNIVAKRGALFMVNLKHEVQERGFTVAHIKTDSIKIPNATPEIIQFVMDYGKQYGYTFEHEATYERMCLVNDAVYIARYDNGEWTATGKQFQVPYVFKKLFSHEDILFADRCETKSVSTSLYLDMNENLPDGEHNYTFVGKVGLFCPIKPGRGGGVLVREKDGKYDAATGTKGYRWLEADMVKTLCKQDDIDESYYISLVDAAIETISKYGDFEAFVSDDKVLPEFMNVPETLEEEVPF